MDAQSALAGLEKDTNKKIAENEGKKQKLQEKQGELSQKDTEKFDNKNNEILKDEEAQKQNINDQSAGAGLDEQGNMLKGGSIDDVLINTAKGIYDMAHWGVLVASAVGIAGAGAGVVFGAIMPFLSGKDKQKKEALDELDIL